MAAGGYFYGGPWARNVLLMEEAQGASRGVGAPEVGLQARGALGSR